jgi:hypothetical protein
MQSSSEIDRHFAAKHFIENLKKGATANTSQSFNSWEPTRAISECLKTKPGLLL